MGNLLCGFDLTKRGSSKAMNTPMQACEGSEGGLGRPSLMIQHAGGVKISFSWALCCRRGCLTSRCSAQIQGHVTRRRTNGVTRWWDGALELWLLGCTYENFDLSSLTRCPSFLSKQHSWTRNSRADDRARVRVHQIADQNEDVAVSAGRTTVTGTVVETEMIAMIDESSGGAHHLANGTMNGMAVVGMIEDPGDRAEIETLIARGGRVMERSERKRRRSLLPPLLLAKR